MCINTMHTGKDFSVARYFHTSLLPLALLLAFPALSRADEPPDSPRFSLDGYGEIFYSHYNYGPDQKSSPKGAPADSRAVIDLGRLSLELETELASEIELEAEVEIEHGGTGGALEIEYEEFGEYEREIEKGGEVVLEELFLQRAFGEALRVRLGHFYVGVGLQGEYDRPMDFLGTHRPESEAAVIPATWDETGAELFGHFSRWRYRLQVVNGLDATGFDSQNWIVVGHQRRFEQVRATDMALVARLDFDLAAGRTLGFSAYRGDSAGNRPKPDMKGIGAHVSILDLHGSIHTRRFRAQGLALFGHLEHADLVSQYNRNLSNNLDVLRTPVASRTYALYAEAGYDLLPLLIQRPDERLYLFGRFDSYDTMAGVPAGFFDSPRFARRIYTLGLNYSLGDAVVLKGDYAMRRPGGNLNGEDTASLALGFEF